MTYKIDFLNNSLEIVNPTIQIKGLNVGNPKVLAIDFITLKYSVDINLITENVNFGMALENVQAESLDFKNDGANMPQQVLTALNEQFAI